jgi:hypothetical protein
VKGKKRAVVKIQSHIRRYLCMKKFKHLKEIMVKVLKIQGKWKAILAHRDTQKKIVESQQAKLNLFNQMQS